MKKAISVLAVLLLSAALFTGCDNGNGNVSSAPGVSDIIPDVSSMIPSEPIESRVESGEVSSHVDDKTSSVVSGVNSHVASGEESPAASE